MVRHSCFQVEKHGYFNQVEVYWKFPPNFHFELHFGGNFHQTSSKLPLEVEVWWKFPPNFHLLFVGVGDECEQNHHIFCKYPSTCAASVHRTSYLW